MKRKKKRKNDTISLKYVTTRIYHTCMTHSTGYNPRCVIWIIKTPFFFPPPTFAFEKIRSHVRVIVIKQRWRTY